MWVMSQDGFTSAVYKNKKFQLRSRDRESLQRMGFKSKRIVTGVGTDYPFRVYLSKREYKRIICRQIDAIDYSNFKDRVAVTRGKNFSNALHDVWFAMLKVEPKNALSLLGKASFRTYTPGNRVASWWPEYSSSKRSYDAEPEVWDRYDAWESRDRDLPEVDDFEEHPSLLEGTRSIHSLSDEEWAELEKHGML